MRCSVTIFTRVGLVLTLVVSGASPASAQLGKLKKMGADAVKEAAAGKKPEPAKNPTAARVDYAITEERLSAIMNVLTPLAVSAQREADARAVSAGYNEKVKAANDCFSKVTSGNATPDMSVMQSPKYEALLARSQTMAERLAAAQTGKRYREFLALSDTFAILQLQNASMLFKNNCPPVPYKPAALLDLEASKIEQRASAQAPSSDELSVPSHARGNMTTGQFGRIRERMAIWALMQAGDLPATADKFTDDEKAVLTARAADLRKFGPLFKTGTMQWASWGDITSW
ncbi:MAG: hypothetical protein ABMA00_01545 [Gemmatimonas sp.]